jgi:type I restriction enzyme S subunit
MTLLDEFIRAVFESQFKVDPRDGGVPVDELVEVNPVRRLRPGTPAAYVGMKSLPTTGSMIANWEQKPAGSGQRFTNGDTLIARITPCLENGKTGFVNILADGETGWGSTEYVVIRPKPPLPPEWGYCLARDQSFREFAIRNMSGTSGRQRFPASALHHYRIEPPSTDRARRFGELAGPSFRLMGVMQAESGRLASLRDELLPRLLSGVLRMRDATTLVGEAV